MEYIYLFVISFLSATVLPFSSEAVFLYEVEAGNFLTLLFAASIGNWLGSVFTYWCGWHVKWEWIERYLRVKKTSIEKYQPTISKYGYWIALICWIPFVGDILAIGLGVFRVNVKATIFFLFIGKFLRYLLLGLMVV